MGLRAVIDLVSPGPLHYVPAKVQALRRVGAYAGIPSAEVREVIQAVEAAMDAALIKFSAAELLPRMQEVVEQLASAGRDYDHLRDSIAGRLDRMEAEMGDSQMTERGAASNERPRPAFDPVAADLGDIPDTPEPEAEGCEIVVSSGSH